MKRIGLALILGSLLLVLGCSKGTPMAVALPGFHDFGDVPVVTDMSKAKVKEFFIRNEGTATLKLEKPQVKLLEGC